MRSIFWGNIWHTFLSNPRLLETWEDGFCTRINFVLIGGKKSAIQLKFAYIFFLTIFSKIQTYLGIPTEKCVKQDLFFKSCIEYNSFNNSLPLFYALLVYHKLMPIFSWSHDSKHVMIQFYVAMRLPWLACWTITTIDASVVFNFLFTFQTCAFLQNVDLSHLYQCRFP